jgi:hypothetical protein
MSHRNVAHGADGSIAHARDEFAYARSVGAKCGLLVGQQFGDVQPPEITFHGLDRHDFQQAAERIVDGYRAVWQRDAAA